jgi:hypothetical protein
MMPSIYVMGGKIKINTRSCVRGNPKGEEAKITPLNQIQRIKNNHIITK